jgi:HNH endonuclease
MGDLDKQTRFRILALAKFTCFYCGRRAPEVKLEVDHVDPRSNGGASTPENLVATCFDCNRGKSGATLNEPQKKADAFPVGKWFHYLDDDGYVQNQGEIVGLVEGGIVVQMYDWVLGYQSAGRRVLPLDWGRWIFYDSNTEMREAYAYHLPRRPI